jgi:hypothetical protein
MMANLTLDANRDLIWDVLFGELEGVDLDAARAEGRHWVMAPEMLEHIRRVDHAQGGAPLWPPPSGARQEIIGLPVELRAGAEGVHLETGAIPHGRQAVEP